MIFGLMRRSGFVVGQADVVPIPLYPIAGLSGFRLFLVNDRIRLLQKLIVLHNFCKGATFGIGYLGFHQSVGYDTQDEPLWGEKQDCICQDMEPENSVFEHVLSKLCIGQVDSRNGYIDYYKKRVGATPVLIPDAWSAIEEEWDETVYVRLGDVPMVILDNMIFVPKEDEMRVKSVFGFYEGTWDALVDTYGGAVAVSHDVYIDLLLKIFPGKIRIRALT